MRSVWAVSVVVTFLLIAPSCVSGVCNCHQKGWCLDEDAGTCECQQGTLDIGTGDPGLDCKDTGATVRYVLATVLAPTLTSSDVDTLGLCSGLAQGFYLRAMNDAFTEVNCLYLDTPAASADVAWYTSSAFPAAVTAGPNVYIWVLPSPDNPIPIPATGLEIATVSWSAACATTGCWIVTGKLTTGETIDEAGAFNTLYLPYAIADGEPPGSASYDTNYAATGNHQGPEGSVAVEWTFSPANHPCTSAGSDASSGNTQEVTTCCIVNRGVGQFGEGGPVGSVNGWIAGSTGGFLSNYRPMQSFVNWAAGLADCTGKGGEVIDRPGYDELAQGVTVDVLFPADHLEFLSKGADKYGGGGKFLGLTDTAVTNFTLLDPFSGQYEFTIELDEVEVRNNAGKMKGSVGVEHIVDTFIGLANFRPTGLVALDTFVTQAALHFEKTNLFTVSTHGVNDYTFLEYINLRLVSVYVEDADFSGQTGPNTNDDEALNRTIRTNTDKNINYIQVTFTVGEKYGVNNFPIDDKFESGFIPINSVRAGLGTFLPDTPLEPVCTTYLEAENAADSSLVGLSYVGESVTKATFDDTLDQPCGPAATMCVSPNEIPDQFVSFNIPLGSEVFDDTQSINMEFNIFVHFVVNAIDKDARGVATDPNNGEAPWQVKTTLSGSVPIVPGGINIFCDALTAKTDLLDIAEALLLIGSTNGEEGGRRSSPSELSLYRRTHNKTHTATATSSVLTVPNAGSTTLSPSPTITTEATSTQSGVVTVNILGSTTYFAPEEERRRRGGRRAGTSSYSLEVEDMFTIHLMEDGRAPPVNQNDGSISAIVESLMAQPPEDNTDDFGLQTEGYKLNGAFRMSIDRAKQRGRLQPTPELLAVCPFSATRPSPTALVVEVCITRREINERETYSRPGAVPTSLEVARPPAPPMACSDEDVSSYLDTASPSTAPEAEFFANLMGDSSFSRTLGVDFARAINQDYHLNGRYRRAWWISPAYEWTPTQSGNANPFDLSQRMYIFALISLDENFGARRASRRMLLQTGSDSPLADSGRGLASANLKNAVTISSMMAGTFKVPLENVGIFEVELQLDHDTACEEPVARQGAVMSLLEDYVTRIASPVHSVQVLSLQVDMNGEQCNTRRRLLAATGLSAAVGRVSMLVVFQEQEKESPKFDLKVFQALPDVLKVKADRGNSETIWVGDETIWSSDRTPPSDKEEESSDGLGTGALVGIIVGSVGFVALLAAAFVVYRIRKNKMGTTIPVAQGLISQGGIPKSEGLYSNVTHNAAADFNNPAAIQQLKAEIA